MFQDFANQIMYSFKKLRGREEEFEATEWKEGPEESEVRIRVLLFSGKNKKRVIGLVCPNN